MTDDAIPLLIVWVILAAIIGSAAPGRGRSFAAWTLVAILFSPLVAAVGLVLLPSLKEQRARDDAMSVQLAATQSAAHAAAAAADKAATPREDTMGALGRLADLRDRGALTDEEFAAKKAELLARV